MAPKPKVWITVQRTHWKWSCSCGVASRPWSSWQIAHNEATRHSRTHTAERVAEQLDRHALARRADSIAAIDAAGAETDYSIYQRGVARGLERAENLIRKHLVKEEP